MPIFYSVAMAVSGGGSLLFGYLLDRLEIGVLVGLTIVSLFSTPLAFLGNFWVALIGAAIWGFGMGAHESLIPALVAHMVAPERLGSAYGIFTAAYGVCWFAGSVIRGHAQEVGLNRAIDL